MWAGPGRPAVADGGTTGRPTVSCWRAGTLKAGWGPPSAMSGRPLDVLEAALGDPVAVLLKDGTLHRGALAGYDQHMNLVLDPPDADDAAGDGADRDEDAVDSTIVIRGDNVVTIRP